MNIENYSSGDYQSMNVQQKLSFLQCVHTGELSLWDDNGDESFIWDDFHAVEDELRQHPELFSLDDMQKTMEIINDDCFEISWQWNLASMLFNVSHFYGREGISFFLQHLQEVPENGRFHGWHFPIQWLMGNDDDYAILKELLPQQNGETKQCILEILNDIEIHEERRDVLIQLCN